MGYDRCVCGLFMMALGLVVVGFGLVVVGVFCVMVVGFGLVMMVIMCLCGGCGCCGLMSGKERKLKIRKRRETEN